MALPFDIKEGLSLLNMAGMGIKDTCKRLKRVLLRVRGAAQHYDSKELGEMNDEICECSSGLNAHFIIYIAQHRKLLEVSETSSTFCYFPDENGPVDDWDEERGYIYDAGICLCRWRDELREDEQDEVTRAQLSLIETLISTLGKTLRVFEENGYGTPTGIERAYQVMVVQQVNNYYEYNAGSVHIDCGVHY